MVKYYIAVICMFVVLLAENVACRIIGIIPNGLYHAVVIEQCWLGFIVQLVG